MADHFVLDDIVEELDDSQLELVADFWKRLDTLTSLESFDSNSFRPGTDVLNPDADLSWVRTKQMRKAYGDLTPLKLHESLRRNAKHEDPDTLLVRFLRARKWNLDDAVYMMVNTVRWRLEEDVAGLLEGGDGKLLEIANHGTGEQQKIAAEILEQIRCGQSFVRGRDKHGKHLEWIRVCLHDPKMQGEKGFIRATILDTETSRMLLRAPDSSVSVVFDMTGFGMGNMDWNAIKLMTAGLQDHYPESLSHIYVYAAPWIVNGIWSVVRTWLDPVVASKVHFLRNVTELAEWIPLEYIPKYLGGQDEWEYHYIEPTEGETTVTNDPERKQQLLQERDRLLDEHAELTRQWAAKIGTQEGDKLLVQRREVAFKLQKNYWQLDPFVRGRSHIDRAGILKLDGSVNL